MQPLKHLTILILCLNFKHNMCFVYENKRWESGILYIIFELKEGNKYHLNSILSLAMQATSNDHILLEIYILSIRLWNYKRSESYLVLQLPSKMHLRVLLVVVALRARHHMAMTYLSYLLGIHILAGMISLFLLNCKYSWLCTSTLLT